MLIPTKAEALSLYCAVNLGYLLVPMSFFSYLMAENQIRTLCFSDFFPLFLLIF